MRPPCHMPVHPLVSSSQDCRTGFDTLTGDARNDVGYRLTSGCGGRRISPSALGLGPEPPMRRTADEVALRVECVVHGSMDRGETLSRFRRLEPLHLALAPADGLMRILCSIVRTKTLLMTARKAEFSQCCAVGSELVGDDRRWNEAIPRRTPAQTARRSAGAREN